MADRDLIARLADGVARFDAADWDRCAGTDNPFTTHAFLSALEESGSATAATGWQPIPIAIDEAVEKGVIKEGTTALLVAFGAGFTWASMIIRF